MTYTNYMPKRKKKERKEKKRKEFLLETCYKN